MGTFRVSCEEADGAVMMMGLGEKQSTTIYRSGEEGTKTSVVVDVPSLKLSGDSNARRWRTMTKNFKPIRF